MTLTITIDMDNDAFADDNGRETSRILRELSSRVKDWTLEAGDYKKIRDINGNTVGSLSVSDD